MSCGVGRRRGSDLALLWPWRRPVTLAQIVPLAWEPPYALGVALERQKKKKKKKESSIIVNIARTLKKRTPQIKTKLKKNFFLKSKKKKKNH